MAKNERLVNGFRYNIKAHPTTYKGVRFRSRHEARWAVFFDVLEWAWEYEPIDLKGWSPDFRVTFPCSHSECSGSHSLLVEVKPYFHLEEFIGHPCMDYPYGRNGDKEIPADASACFGNGPRVTRWEMAHGVGGGVYDVESWENIDLEDIWAMCGNVVQYLRR